MKRRPTAPVVIPVTTLIEQGRRALVDGQWREAVERCKQLLKQDPTGGWEPLLAEAYEGRAAELAGKAMYKEALILLDNADRLWTTPRCNPLRLTCLVAVGRLSQAVACYMRAEATLPTTRPGLFPFLQEYVAVLLLLEADAVASVPLNPPWPDQAAAARRALAAFCRPGQPDLEHHLRQIAVRSPFKPLRLILKAMGVVREQPDKAQEWVAAIPDSSPWAGMAGLIPLCTMEMTELLQRTDDLSPPAVAIAVAWRGISPEPWQRVQGLLKATPARVLSAVLDRNLPWAIPEAPLRRMAFLLLVADPNALAVFERRFGPLDELEKRRLAALAKTRTAQRAAEVIRAWQLYLNQLKATPDIPDHPIKMAMTHRLLATLIGGGDPEDPQVLSHLEQSLTYDPGDRSSHRMLLAHHKEQEEGKDYRRVLERALQQFPEDAEFLYAAVQSALQSQSFKKASRLAKRLLAQDPLHAGVRRALVGACLAQARKQVKNGRVDLAVRELAEASTWERPAERDGVLQINQAFLAWLTGATAEGDDLLAAGKQQAGDDLSACLRAEMEGCRMELPAPWPAQLTEALRLSARAAATREATLALVQVAQAYVGENRLRLRLTDLADYWLRASKLAFTLEEFRAICHLLAKAGVYGILTPYATQGEKKWRDHQIFVYYRLLAKYKGPRPNIAPRDRDRLHAVLEQAEAQKDHALVAELEEWLDEGDPFEDLDFMPPFMPRSGSSPEQAEQTITMLLTGVARMFMDANPRLSSRDEMRGFLMDFLKEAPLSAADKKKLVSDHDRILEKVLDELFPPVVDRRPDPPSAKGRARPVDPRQLILDFDDP